MKNNFKALFFVSAVFIMNAAQADGVSALYWGSDYSAINFQYKDVANQRHTSSRASFATLTVGVPLDAHFSVEARMGVGVSDASISLSDESLSISLNGTDQEAGRYYGLYAKYLIPAFSPVDFYAVAGYTRGEFATAVLDESFESFSVTGDDYSYGVGGLFRLTDQLAVNAEYLRLFSTSDEGDAAEQDDVEAFSIGFRLDL